MMAPFFLVLLAASPVFAGPGDQRLVQLRDYEDRSRIIEGHPATIDEFPFIVALIYWEKNESLSIIDQSCGGTIITQDWVLTAGHCIHPVRADRSVMTLIYIRAGSSFKDTGGIIRDFTNIVKHTKPPQDIALIKVSKPWPLNGITISLARLPRQGDPVPVGSPATIIGWGRTHVNGTLPEILMKQTVMVTGDFFCWVANFWALLVVPGRTMCTYLLPGHTPTGIYKGDTGGPVVANGEVIGIISHTHWRFYLPDVHTRVSSFIDWIEEKVGPLPN